MGCSPSALLEHIHRESSQNHQQEKVRVSKSCVKVMPTTTQKKIKESKRGAQSNMVFSSLKDTTRGVFHRKSSLALTPEEEPLDTHRGFHENKLGQISPPTNRLKILTVFSTLDQVGETILKAAEKLNFDVSLSNSDLTALEEYQQKLHDLVIIDTRLSKTINYDTLCRSIRNTRGNQHTVVVALVKKSVYEKDDNTIGSLLDSGYNRCMVETTNVVACLNELILLRHSDIRPLAQHTTTQGLYSALDKCRDLVIVTDDTYKLQYINRACEKQLGVRQEEILGKTLQDQIASDPIQINSMASSLLRGKEWSGPVTLKKKPLDNVLSSCKAVPFASVGRLPTHFILVFDLNPTDHLCMLTQSRGSIHSIRRGSNDVRSVGSDFLRRTSLAKLNSLPLEAPITKVISLIDQARETSNQNPSVVQLLDRVEDILKSCELYTTNVKEDLRIKSDEPVVSDLITALLSKQPQPTLSGSSRRSSNDSSVFRQSRGGFVKVPAAIKELLENSLIWEFDIFRLEDMTKKRPLQYLGMNLFNHFEVASVLNCDEKTLFNWLTVIEANYHMENSYHNSTHAADVMQATAGFLEKERMKSIMEQLDEATTLIAAAAHDVDHPGKSSAFLSNSDNILAILYNDVTVLESHHAALTFKLTLGDDRINIFKNLDRETYKIARSNVIDMILATEMTKHFEHLAKFVNVFCPKASSNSDPDGDVNDYAPLSIPENVTLVKRMLIKCADVSNPTRPLRLCVEWARRITDEYFLQTDEEKNKGLPVVMPMFDRFTCSIPKSQIGFVDYIINDMFEAWNAFLDMPELLTYMRQNYIRWKELDEQGHTTLVDIQKLQSTPLMNPMLPPKPANLTD
ncbi:high affinity cAMP-specific and IBMX-insensitive 3',5'-cyclic phosphodiesterase 8 isoform X2 [Diorhabda sublineata]|uniref:high affinity cAMP-specific and IBMX-insensitive 3',5'-cyclic phosphodiesterase 8 isoform X2 n=1 Tax=Diorhabda sublineata TaxID=1163346 RepID=UPI0024E0B0E6|nr:high affinity cAMP-specific and IBMX-insensitive 3',5'-cyclic phosphodiesterase 8 isoform X2 [Diorhabda sublineata]